MLGLGGVDREILGSRIFTHDHALVHLVPRTDEQFAPGLDVPQGVGHGFTLVHRDQGPGPSCSDVSRVRPVLLEQMGHDSLPARQVEQLELKADQATRGNGCLQRGPPPIRRHRLHLALSVCERLHASTHRVIRHLHVKCLERLMRTTVNFLLDHGGPANEYLEAFPSHFFHHDGDLHGPAGIDPEFGRLPRFLELDRNVRPGLPDQTIANLSGSHPVSLPPGHGPVVDGE